MDIHIIPCLKDNYAYIVENKKTKNVCVVDPSESEPVINFLKTNKLNLKYILNTILLNVFIHRQFHFHDVS